MHHTLPGRPRAQSFPAYADCHNIQNFALDRLVTMGVAAGLTVEMNVIEA